MAKLCRGLSGSTGGPLVLGKGLLRQGGGRRRKRGTKTLAARAHGASISQVDANTSHFAGFHESCRRYVHTMVVVVFVLQAERLRLACHGERGGEGGAKTTAENKDATSRR